MSDRQTTYSELAEILGHIPLLLKEARRGRHLSMRKAARQMGIAATTVMRIEDGGDYNSRILPALLTWLDRPADGDTRGDAA